MTEQKTYQLFDTAEDQPEVHLRLTSNKNIERVSDVLTNYKNADFDERLYYAKQLDTVPIARDESGKPETDANDNVIVEFENKYLNVQTYWAGLAQALFTGCPKLVVFNDEDEAQLNKENQELIDSLIRESVYRGLEDFLGKFGLKPYKQDGLFDLFQIDQKNPNLINQAADILQENSDLLNGGDRNMKTKSQHGETASPADTATGNSSK